jgi:hypothetical protein
VGRRSATGCHDSVWDLVYTGRHDARAKGQIYGLIGAHPPQSESPVPGGTVNT